MEEPTKAMAKLSLMASRVISCADEAQWQENQCSELKSETERLAALLRRAARADDLYARPAQRILGSTEQVLERALALITKCCSLSLMTRVFNNPPTSAFTALSNELSNAITNISWLLRVSGSASETFDEDGGVLIDDVPPIAQNERPIALIWNQIAALRSGSLAARSESAFTLASLAGDGARYAKLIIEEDGVGPLIRIIKEGPAEGRESAAHAMGHLGRDPKSVEHLVHAGVCAAFVKVLKEGSTGAQAAVAGAIAELAANYPRCQDLFAQHSAVRLLLRHLAVDTKRESPVFPAATKANMKATVAKALWRLAKGNPAICKSVAEADGALLCFAEHIKRAPEHDVRYYSVLAVMEIARVAEGDVVLRRSAFRPHSATAKAVIDSLLGMVYKGAQSKLLVPCVAALGCLAKTFRDGRIIGPLVQLLDERDPDVMREAAVALTKFASTEASLHVDHSKAIVDAGGARHLVQLVYLGEQVQMEALILLCYVALHTPMPDSEELARAGVLAVLAWASNQPKLVQDLRVDSLLPEARGRLELHQSNRSR